MYTLELIQDDCISQRKIVDFRINKSNLILIAYPDGLYWDIKDKDFINEIFNALDNNINYTFKIKFIDINGYIVSYDEIILKKKLESLTI